MRWGTEAFGHCSCWEGFNLVGLQTWRVDYCGRANTTPIWPYPLVNVYITNWKDPPCYSWENSLFPWPCSIAFCMFTRGSSLPCPRAETEHHRAALKSRCTASSGSSSCLESTGTVRPGWPEWPGWPGWLDCPEAKLQNWYWTLFVDISVLKMNGTFRWMELHQNEL